MIPSNIIECIILRMYIYVMYLLKCNENQNKLYSISSFKVKHIIMTSHKGSTQMETKIGRLNH